MRVIRAPEYIIRALEAEQRDGNIRLDERHSTSILE